MRNWNFKVQSFYLFFPELNTLLVRLIAKKQGVLDNKKVSKRLVVWKVFKFGDIWFLGFRAFVFI
jgi:hypothetical protein